MWSKSSWYFHLKFAVENYSVIMCSIIYFYSIMYLKLDSKF